MSFQFNQVSTVAVGIGDSASKIGLGTAFQSTSTDVVPTDHNVNASFIDPVYFLNLLVSVQGALLGDTIDFTLNAPATNINQGTQSVNLQAITGGNLVVPVPSGGSNTIDVNNSVPVPNVLGTGWWDWSFPNTGKGVITPNFSQGGAYDLFDFLQKPSRMMQNVPLLGTQNFDIGVRSDNPFLILPQWNCIAKIHNMGHAALNVAWTVLIARIRTTN